MHRTNPFLPYDGQVWVGRWIRTLHRYASDAIIVATAFHLLRMFAQNRTWGPRALAWVSGLILLFVVYVCGWTGFVMVWDVQGIVSGTGGCTLARRPPDLFRTNGPGVQWRSRHTHGRSFFLNLFLHVALPIGLAVILWVHTARIARPSLLPPRGLAWGLIAILFVASVTLPAQIGPAADPLVIPGRAPYDVFYAFWFPVTQALPPLVVWADWFGGRPHGGAHSVVDETTPCNTTPPSRVVERLCDGCEQCYLDCPYEAIAMVERTDGRDGLVSRVDPQLCVSCGICSGSCAPMGVGPAGRTGRDQLDFVKTFILRLVRNPPRMLPSSHVNTVPAASVPTNSMKVLGSSR